MFQSMTIRVKLMLAFLVLAVITAVTGVFGLVYITKVGHLGERAATQLAPLSDAAMEIKLSATRAHLTFEEISGGDETVKIEEVWKLLDESAWYAQAILKGGKNEEGEYHATQNPQVAAIITRVAKKIVDFKEAAQSRYELIMLSRSAGAKADADFDQSYDQIQEKLDQLVRDHFKPEEVSAVYHLGQARFALANAHLNIEEFLAGDQSVKLESILGQMKGASTRVERVSKIVGEDKAKELTGLIARFVSASEVRAKNRSMGAGAGSEVEGRFDDAFESFMKDAEEAETIINNTINTETVYMLDQIQLSRTLMIAVVVGGVLLAVILGLVLSGSINNLLFKLITHLSNASTEIAEAAAEVSSSSQNLADGAAKQAAGLEETSSAMEQIAAQTQDNANSARNAFEAVQKVAEMVHQSAKNAESVNQLANQARDSAENGTAAMGDISRAMREIREESDKITDIIQVINEITHQTKMLATNAAIEAARAGEQGKGFAVVADEVSKLAENSKVSAKEIANLIKGSAHKAQAGEDLATRGEGILQEILEQSAQVANLVSEISASSSLQADQVIRVEQLVEEIQTASKEQSHGVSEVSRALVEIDRVTQDNAANAEETAASSEEMASQSEILLESVGEIAAFVGADRTAKNAKRMAKRTHEVIAKFEAQQRLQTAAHGHKAPQVAAQPKTKAQALPSKAQAESASKQIPMEDFTEF